jgi:hypothetical protein
MLAVEIGLIKSYPLTGIVDIWAENLKFTAGGGTMEEKEVQHCWQVSA